MPSSHRAAIIFVLLTAPTSTLRTACAFAPASTDTRHLGRAEARVGAPRRDERGRRAAGDSDGDGVDVVVQKLRRNAERGPIDPVKEHEEMRKENECEAQANVTAVSLGSANDTDVASVASVLYSHAIAAAIDPDFDPAASVDEQYLETQLRGLLSRRGDELARLGPGFAALPLDPASDEAASEEDLSRLEAALERAARAARAAASTGWDEANLVAAHARQSAALDRAATLQADVDRHHLEDGGAVLLANLAFYEALSLRDAAGMRDAWWEGPGVVCVHPSRAALVGGRAVVGSFAAMFENGIRGQRLGGGLAGGSAYVNPTNIRGLTVRGTSASLVCDEEVYARGPGEDHTLVNKLLTTNMFRKIGGRWKMAHRHASWHPETTAARDAMKAKPGLAPDDDAKEGEQSAGARHQSQRAKGKMTLQRLNGNSTGTSKRVPGLPSIPPSLEGLDANAVLGIPVPEEEEQAKQSGADKDVGGMIGKIINLSDLMGGPSASGGEEGSGGKGLGDAIADMLTGNADADSTSTSGSGTPEDPFITRRVFKIGTEDLIRHGKDQEKDEDEEKEEKDVVIDLRGKSEEERRGVLARLAAGAASDDSVAAAPAAGDGLRRRCIATLRELAESGRLSRKHKRVLLTDIITASARGETSMVEVAHELLCTGGEEGGNVPAAAAADINTGMDDFTEQCRVFAAMDED